LGGVRLVWAHEISLKGLIYRGEAGFDLVGVVGGAVAGEQEFEHEGRRVGALLDPLHQILAHDTRPGKMALILSLREFMGINGGSQS
jgi:hypothetical protein